MEVEAARSFVQEHHRAVLATRRKDGSPQLSPIAVATDDEGRFVVSSRETAYKVRNLRRDPEASVCVIPDSFYGEWIQIDGIAEIVSLPEAMELLVEYYRSVSGEHPDWGDYRAAMERDRRVVIRITAARVGPDRAG